MKAKYLLLAVIAIGGFFTTVNSALAQTPPTLAGQLYMGVSITGTVGTVYAIQAATDVTQSNGWSCLAFVQLPATNYLWIDTSTPVTGRRFYRAVATAPTNLVFVPPGTFRMGSQSNEVDRLPDEGPQTVVTLTKGFYIGKYLVAQGDYLAVVGRNPSYFNTNNGFNLDLTRPVEKVSWNDATNYCAKRTQQEAAAGRIATGSHYRLPTEAEWEYACRAWTSDRRFYYGDDLGYTELVNYAWYWPIGGISTYPAGQKLPNAWGLYDMAGNVWEWCQDWYGPYPGGSVNDPHGPGSGAFRVLRGGSWSYSPLYCRSAYRNYPYPSANTRNDIGFRVVLAPGQP